MGRVLPVLLILGLTVYAAIDAAGTPSEQMRAGTKASWLVVILLLPILGPVLWLLSGRPKKGPAVMPPTGPARPGAVGPDDDPEFLRLLEERQRRLRRQQSRPDDEPPALT